MIEDLHRSSEERRAAFLGQVESLLKDGADVAVAADFDQNISRSGTSLISNPTETSLDPVARQAFLDIQNSGRDVVIITSRGARDMARIANLPGIGIVGSLGWETFIADANDPTQGTSHIHPKFEPFRDQITGILGDVRRTFFQRQLGLSPDIADEPNLALPIPEGGQIILQRKGYNRKYPEGINLTWNLNGAGSDDQREHHRAALAAMYEQAFAIHSAGITEVEKERLAQLCGLRERAGHSRGLPTLDIEMRPKSEGAKRVAIIQLMRLPDATSESPKRRPHFQHMPSHKTWIYSGDHAQQDGAPMRAGHTAYKFTRGQGGVLGVWSKPVDAKLLDIRGVDVIVNGVSGNAALLKDIAALMKYYPAA